MKTPQEEAERIARIAGMNHNLDDAVRTTILRETAIVELIAVARAANQLVSATTHAAQFNYEELLAESVIALRATGKVEGI